MPAIAAADPDFVFCVSRSVPHAEFVPVAIMRSAFAPQAQFADT
jgi:hypothetical protein